MKRRIAALLLAVAVLLNMTACANKGGDTFRYDFGAQVTNLDPQFATQEEAKTVLANCMEGLLRQSGGGEIELAAAQSMEVSEDGKVYTFTLRPDALWSDGTPVTAHDFVFGLRRLFDRSVLSPYTEDFLCLRNGRAVLEGMLPADLLGIKAEDDHTLVITLEQANPFFEIVLTTPAAMPCNEEFFRSTRGRYGLDKGAMLYNGPFSITTWNEEKVTLYCREGYTGHPVLPEAVVFYIGRDDPQRLLIEGKADAGAIDEERLAEAVKEGLNYTAYDNAVWGLVFNQQRRPLDDLSVRQALQMTLDRSYITGTLPENRPATAAVIPPAITLEGGRSYREAAGEVLEPVYTPEAGRALYQTAMENLEMDSLSVTLLMPEGEEYMACAGLIQQQWQQNLSFYLNLEALPQEEYYQRLSSYDYDIALVQIRSSVDSPAGVLGKFLSSASENVARYRSPGYDELVSKMAEAPTMEEVVRYASRAEDMLINDAVVVPLFLSTSYFATGPSVRDLEYSPYSGRVMFHSATK